MDPPMEVVKFLYVHSRDTNGARLARGGVTLAVERRSSDGRVLVAMVKCPEHKVFDESRGRHAAEIKFSAGYYTVMTLEILAAYVGEPVESINALLTSDTSTQT